MRAYKHALGWIGLCLLCGLVACAPAQEQPSGDEPEQPGASPDAGEGRDQGQAGDLPQDAGEPGPDATPERDAGADLPADASDSTDSGPNLSGGALYHQQCASCHGSLGEGSSGPPLQSWPRGRQALVEEIAQTMPLGRPQDCQGACAEAVADFMLRWFGEGEPVDCEQTPVGHRQLRLLTRREYRNTVRDLFAMDGVEGGACEQDTDCDLQRQVCLSGQCAQNPCGVHTFVYDPGDRSLGAVHVAGSFNGWAASVDQGGWAMEHLPAENLWIARRRLEEGQRYSYKFVLDGQEWISDPDAEGSEPDGFGGSNSVLTVRCAQDQGLDLESLMQSFPPETRPQGYSFDNHADAGRVTGVHVEEYMALSGQIARWALEQPGGLLPCQAGAPGCARAFVEGFGARAFRRPLQQAEVDRYVALIEAQPDFMDGVEVALRVFLTSPSFLYRFELGQPNGDGTWTLDGYERASALSYLFWGSMPDDALLEAAGRGELDSPQGLERHARRMLQDPRAREVIGLFGLQWLGVERISSVNKQPELFPDFDSQLRQDMLEETRRFIGHVIFDGSGQFAELMTADYSFTSARLARLYGASPDAQGRIQHAQGRRAGILGHGSVLGSYAHSDQTSPIKRGVFVRERLLCQEFGMPPANAGGVPDVDPDATTRERFAQHSDDPACHDCHQYIDGVGFGFENFDAIGQWRDSENGAPVDSSGDLNDKEGFGTLTHDPFGSLGELGQLLASSRRAQACFATQVHRFATGRLEEPADACALERVEARFAQSGGDIRELLLSLITTPEFTQRR